MANDLPPYRVCDLCGGVDQDPRHVIPGVITGVHPVDEGLRDVLMANISALQDAKAIGLNEAYRLIADYEDTTTQDRHIDCCAASGRCPDVGKPTDCGPRAAKAAGRTGPAMREVAMSFATEG